jgi:HAD superfamily hydrolase (TIGR01509 family)
MLPKDLRAFIFDMDGVLINTEELYKGIEQELFQELGLTISDEEHFSYQGCSNPVMWSRIKRKHNISNALDELVERLEEKVICFFRNLPVVQPMPDVVVLLQTLKARGIRLALASSSTIQVIDLMMSKSGLGHFFDVVVDSLEAGAGKPDPAIFLLAQKKLGIPKENCVVIEDSVNGILAARSAGIYCIAYNGPGAEHQDQSAADLIIKSFQELIL